MARDDDRAERHHFKIGEVAELLGVRPHVLRYWEQEFPALRPKKTRGAHRHYSRANVATAQAIRDLIVEQGYSIAGAKIQIAANASGESTGPAMTPDAIGASRSSTLWIRNRPQAAIRTSVTTRTTSVSTLRSS